jgi:hypothetical protein
VFVQMYTTEAHLQLVLPSNDKGRLDQDSFPGQHALTAADGAVDSCLTLVWSPFSRRSFRLLLLLWWRGSPDRNALAGAQPHQT